MQSKNSFFSGCLQIFGLAIASLSIVVALYWATLLLRDKFPEDKQKEVSVLLAELETSIHALPDSKLKRNLYSVLASEYAGDSNELHDLLQAYSQLQIEKIQGKNSL